MALVPAPKPRLTFWQIWNMSFGFLGIQFGFALQNANVSRIFETLGADVDQIPILWIAAPLTGLIVQPIIGYMSDRTWGKLGRRRPYFLIGAILASIALLIMPNSPVLWVAAGMLWIMDASINVSMEPFRAFVGDNLPDEQRTQGFAMQSFFIGTGAVVASALPYLLTNVFGVDNTAPEGGMAPSVTYSFYIGGAVFFAAVLWTVLRSREYSPDELASFEAWEHQHEAAQGSASGEGGSTSAAAGASGSAKTAESAHRKGDFEVRMKTPPPPRDEHVPEPSRLNRMAALWALGGLLLSLGIYQLHLGKKELYIVGFGAVAFGIMLAATAYMIRGGRRDNGFVEVISDLLHMPKTMKQLAVVQFFSWFALFAMWIYSTSAVSRHYYDMNAPASISAELLPYVDELPADQQAEMRESLNELKPLRGQREAGTVYVPLAVAEAFLSGPLKPGADSQQGTPEAREQLSGTLHRIQQQYNNGGDWIGVIFAVYNGVAALVAFLLPLLAARINRRRTHMLCMVIGGLGLASVFVFRSPQMLLLSMTLVGVAWASILSMPYAILSGALPLKKMGVYMGIFNFFIVIPQLVAASILGFLVLTFFGNDPIWALLLGGLSMGLAGLLTLRVEDAKDTAPA